MRKQKTTHHLPTPSTKSPRDKSQRSYLRWFLILSLIVLPSIFVIGVLAAEVVIDNSTSGTAVIHNGSSPTVVFTTDQIGYAFYIDSTGIAVYSKTTDGGTTWGSAVTVDSQSDVIRIAVWYDRWTPGDNTGTNIHILTVDDSGADDDLYYTRLDTSGDGITTPVNVTDSPGSVQGGTFLSSESIPSITKATNGTIYMGIQDNTDSFVVRCSTTCQTASNWTEAGTNPFELDVDWLILMPLAGGDIMAIRWDIEDDVIDSKVYHSGTNLWDPLWTTIDAAAINNITYDGHFGATLNKATNAIFLAYATDVDTLGGANDDIRTAAYNGLVWTAKTDVITNDPTRGITGVKIAAKENSDTVYVVYTARTTPGTATTANVYWKSSTDGMMTWSAEQGPLNTASGDLYGARVNLMSNERIYVTWDNDSVSTLFGNTVVDLVATAAKLSDFTAQSNEKGVFLEWQTGFEADNLGFNVYRESKNGKRVRVNPSVIAGSALMAAPSTEMRAGNAYAWLDTKGKAGDLYYIEDVDINGTRTLHGPVSPAPVPADGIKSNSRQARLLNELNARAAATEGSSASAQRGGPSSSGPSATTTATSASQSQQKALAAMQALKLAVRNEGWYRVTQPQLAAAGFNTSADLRNLQLYADGVEVPIKVNSKKSSGPLLAGDSFEFYGQGQETASTDARTYWLVAGASLGKRLKSDSLSVKLPALTVQSFAYTIELKERLVYFSGLLNGDTENFFGQVINTNPVTQKLFVNNLDTGAAGPARLELALQGVTAQGHAVKVSLNGSEIGVMNFTGQERKVAQLSVTSSLLKEGENLVTLERTNGDTDISIVDYARLTYAHAYRADNDVLKFTINSLQPVRVGGFSNGNITVLDLTDASNVRVISPKVERKTDGYGFNLQASGPRTFLALTDNKAVGPSAITRNEPSNWSQGTQAGADFVIITHKLFRASVEPLAQLRRSEGLSVVVVDVEDVYDEWSYGAHSPQAVRDFLEWAKNNWQRAPRFALLVGDGSYDPRNYLGGGETDLVPTRLVDTAFLETSSDDWLADFDNDGVPEIALGRLPVNTAAEAQNLVARIVNYNPAAEVQSALMVADKTDPTTGFSFETAVNELETLLPATIGVNTVFRGDNSADAVRTEIINGINQGPVLVNYLGHGSVEVWTSAPLLSTTDTDSLANENRLPVFIMMTCLNGYYHIPTRESLAEALLRTDTGGAVAVWASSGMTEPGSQLDANKRLYQYLFGDQPMTLGEAVIKAKQGTTDADVRRTWILFGDPTMRLQ